MRIIGPDNTTPLENDFSQRFETFKELSIAAGSRFNLAWEDRYPCLDDNTPSTGFDRHYIYHCAWAARVLARTRPACHTDISSSLYFCGIASAFVPMRFYDYRPALLQLSNLSSNTADLLALPFENGSIESLSCMHVVEHIGLGRYGDQLDPNGDLKAIAGLKRVLAPGGSLLFVVPLGSPRVMFNAHRIYSYGQVMEYFGELELKQFALIPDDPQDGGLVYDASKALADRQTYGCGCFWLRKKPQ
jgi:SAM-dependent methyltransferase